MSTPALPAGYAIKDDTPPLPGGYYLQSSSAPDITANPGKQGTYNMWDTAGKMHPIPYGNVPSASKQGYKFDTNAAKETGLTPLQQYNKDYNYATTGPGHEAEFEESDRNAPLPMQLVGGAVKGIGTVAKPALDVVGALGGVPQESIDESLKAHGPAEMGAKIATIGATAAPAAIAAPIATASGLAGGTIVGTGANLIARQSGFSPRATALITDAATLAGGTGAAMAGNRFTPTLREMAMEDPDAAALKGLGVGPKSKFSQRTIRSIQATRPYLQGAENLGDLQAKLPEAKSEVWGPYQETIDAIGGKSVSGPNGPTTIGELENQRLELSALNRGLKRGDPASLQLAQQKGLNQADLLAQEKAVQSALDPHLQDAGINPQLIRKTFGQLADVESHVAGKSTLAEPTSRFGVGRIANLSLKHPLAAPAEIGGGVRDLVAGRPGFRGKPTDISIKEGFRTGGTKPNLGEFNPQSQVVPENRQLPAPSPIIDAEFTPGTVEGRTLPTEAPKIPSVITPAPDAQLQLPAEAAATTAARGFNEMTGLNVKPQEGGIPQTASTTPPNAAGTVESTRPPLPPNPQPTPPGRTVVTPEGTAIPQRPQLPAPIKAPRSGKTVGIGDTVSVNGRTGTVKGLNAKTGRIEVQWHQ